jgi:hypothetical protein
MRTIEEIKVSCEALTAFSQQVLLDNLVKVFEAQGKVLDLAYQKKASVRVKSPVLKPFAFKKN